MRKNSVKLCHLFFLLIFFVVASGINFLHIETDSQAHQNCPACHFQNSTLMTSHINFFHLPQLTLLEIVTGTEIVAIDQIVYLSPLSRSPPQV